MPLRFLIPASLLLGLACTPPEVPMARPAEPFVPGLSLRPLGLSLARNATQAFQVEVNYPEGARYVRQPVLWQVLEAGGGSISPAGLYTAPATPGTYHVQVRREDFPEVSATATVTVK